VCLPCNEERVDYLVNNLDQSEEAGRKKKLTNGV
jgi:hypothetical protein